VSTTGQVRHVALYTIIVDGEEIALELATRVHEVRIETTLRLPDACTLRASFPKGKDGQDEPIDRHPFDIGKPIEVRLGEREGLTTATLFKGEIVTLEPQFGAGNIQLLVRGFDRSHRLLRSRRVRTFQNQTASDIVTKIAREAGLNVRCDPSGEVHDFVQQDNETDWHFIWRLAERIGFEFVVLDQTALFRKPGPDHAVELRWPTGLRSFHPRLTAVQQVQEVSLLAHDPKTKQVIDVTASNAQPISQIGVDRGSVASAFDESKLHVATEPVKTQGEGEALAQALLDKLADGYIAAEGVTDGNPKIRAGSTLNVSGVGEHFSGSYRVAHATHVLRGGNVYETHFTNSSTHTLIGVLGADRSAAGPSFGSQLVLGIVTNNDDPDRIGRVRVRYPALGQNAEGAWARIATHGAGKARGSLMLPVVGEEVLVGFEHDDTTRPYVLGSLFNGQDTPDDDLLQGKDGSFALRSDKQIYTESQQDYTIKSAGKLIVEVTDNVQEKYKQDWTVGIDGKASLKSTQPFTIEGQDVSIKGNGQVTLEGMSSLTLKCGAAQIQLSATGVQVSGETIQLG
jgi:phage protein D/phage baseplate assembly protein gpV